MTVKSSLATFLKGPLCCALVLFSQLVLWCTDTNAGNAVKLNDALAAGEYVSEYRVSNDGSFVIYEVKGASNPKIYRADIGGDAPVLLASIPWDDVSVEEMKISPDDLYLAMKLTSADQESLVVLSMDGTGGLRDVDDSVGTAVHFKWSPNGRYLVFNVHPGAAYYYKSRINSALIPEDPSTPLPDAVELYKQTEEETLDFRLTPDGQTVVFHVYSETGGSGPGFYRVALMGGGAAERIGSIAQTVYDFTPYQVSPDGKTVLYQNVVESFTYLLTLEVNGDVDQGSSVISGADDSYHDFNMRFSPDSSRVFYEMPDGSLSTRRADRSAPTVQLHAGVVHNYEVLPDSSRVIMQVASSDSGDELRSVYISGGSSTLIRSGVQSFLVSPDGSKIIFQATEGVDDRAIFAASPTGRNLTRLVYGGGSKYLVEISDDGKRLIYQKSLADTGRARYGVSPVMMLGSQSPLDALELELTGDLVSGGAVYSSELTTGGKFLIYRADQDTDGVSELYAKQFQIEWNPVTRNPGAPWEFASYWDGGLPDASSPTLIADEKICGLSQSGTVVHSLEVKGETSFDAILSMTDSAELTAPGGVVVGSNGIVQGNGAIDVGSSLVSVESGGEIQVAEDELMTINGSGTIGLINQGLLNATGTGSLSAEQAKMTVGGLVENRNSLEAENATLRFDGGLQNTGNMSFGDYARIIGNVENVKDSGGSIQITGYTVFYGSINNGAGFYVNSGVHLKLNATLKGYGIFSGTGAVIHLNGIVSPGFDSGETITQMTFTSDVNLDSDAIVKLEIGGEVAGTEHDVISVGDQLALSGTLDVSLVDVETFRPQAGDTFQLMNAASVSGQFQSIQLPDLITGLYWHDDKISGAIPSDWTGEISVGLAPETYAEFASEHSLTGTGSDDEDGDGIANLLEYVLATHPKYSAPEARIPNLQRVAGNDDFSVDIAVPGSSDVKLEMQRSVDMNEWTTLSTRNADGNWTGNYSPQMSQSEQGRKKYKITVPVGNEKCFYRLKATQR